MTIPTDDASRDVPKSELLAFMNLFHGALSDSFGRRPVVLSGIAVFTLASLGCALSQTIGQLVLFRALQGMAAGAGIVVSRAVGPIEQFVKWAGHLCVGGGRMLAMKGRDPAARLPT